MTVTLKKNHVLQSSLGNAFVYCTREGRRVSGATMGHIRQNLREAGWRYVSNLKKKDFVNMGFEVIEASYANGKRQRGPYTEIVVLGRVKR